MAGGATVRAVEEPAVANRGDHSSLRSVTLGVKAVAANRLLLLALAVALVMRLALFLTAVGHPGRFSRPDSYGYLDIARHLHAAYLGDNTGRLFDLGLMRTPIYPLFVRAVFEIFGDHDAAVVAVQLVLSVATVAVTYWLAARLIPRRVALLAAFLLALDSASIIYSNLILTEALFTFLITLAAALLVVGCQRAAPAFLLAAGCVLGLAALTRPVAEYLPLLLVPVTLFAFRANARARLIAAAALAVGFIVLTGGWIARNATQTGVPVLSTIDGTNMLHYRAVGALEESGETSAQAAAFVRTERAQRVHPADNAARVSRTEMSLGLGIVADHPVGAAKSWVKGAGRILFGPGKGDSSRLLTGRPHSQSTAVRGALALAEIITAIVVLAALIGTVAVLRGRTPREVYILLAIVVYLVVISAGPEAYSRFRVGLEPFIVVLAAIGVFSLRPRRPRTAEPVIASDPARPQSPPH